MRFFFEALGIITLFIFPTTHGQPFSYTNPWNNNNFPRAEENLSQNEYRLEKRMPLNMEDISHGFEGNQFFHGPF
ncbi:Oidioi.mRNA.OKI2018_I69.XSR.g16768.t1.cds [Oikopleura dioica]|uniref:Oidioi.mRNA.OKI2018_I69.XSR.g16768.t1.cds n=1 Tax=Oikopleura dioica TaxID=34765 RepID=A0ABN7SNH8_OIKDI|nr:Oidioi.mRNA.OKI2018_I69.XSR.g16768.t1.cds [Oikopleura dioica]